MKPRSLRLRLKPEQRILALTILRVHGKHRFLLGIVYRGSKWLDGIIFQPLGRKRTPGIGGIVKNSPYFKELRYVMLQGSGASLLDGRRLNQDLELPVIRFDLVRGSMGRVEGWGVGSEEAEAILHAFSTDKIGPKPVYLAKLLRKTLEQEA